MKARNSWKWLGVLAALAFTPVAFAADHMDSPAAGKDPAADITDTFTWMDGGNLVMVMDVVPFATTTSKFSDAVKYVFHTQSGAAYGQLKNPERDVICTFDAAQKISCWAGNQEYITGDASQTSGLASQDGKLKVFAGLRDDPFFFNLTGFNNTVATVEAAAPGLTPNAAGCPAVDSSTSAALVTSLKTPGTDDFAGKNVLSIVVSIDKSLVTQNGSLVAMWASTNK